jgi:hypothetical protein
MSDPIHTSTDHDHIAQSTPRRLLRLDGRTLFAAAIALFATTDQTWWLLPAVILLPDLSMVGYLRDTRVGAHVYNLGHTCYPPRSPSPPPQTITRCHSRSAALASPNQLTQRLEHLEKRLSAAKL